MKGKKSSCKGCHISKHAPSYCEMWFVNKGKLIWTKHASASSSMRLPSCQFATACTHNLRSQSLNSGQKEVIFHHSFFFNFVQKFTFDIRPNLLQVEPSSSSSLGSCNAYTSSSSSSNTEEEGICIQITELKGKVDESKEDSFRILREQKHYEELTREAFNKVILESLNFIFSASYYHMSIR